MHSLLAPSSPFSCSLSCYCRPHVSYRLHFAFLRTIQSYIWWKNGRHSMILGFAAYFKITERLPCIPARSHGMIFRSLRELLVPLKYLTACVFVYVYAGSVWVCIYACMCAVLSLTFTWVRVFHSRQRARKGNLQPPFGGVLLSSRRPGEGEGVGMDGGRKIR